MKATRRGKAGALQAKAPQALLHEPADALTSAAQRGVEGVGGWGGWGGGVGVGFPVAIETNQRRQHIVSLGRLVRTRANEVALPLK